MEVILGEDAKGELYVLTKTNERIYKVTKAGGEIIVMMTTIIVNF
ncbi:MAG TPA: hypothetical protein PLU27_11580 [Ginsengibacter sp.]|nr:hypothetical protein [Ginsengibacter sp.]